MSMRTFKSWRWLSRKKSLLSRGGAHGFRMRQLAFMAIVCIAMMFIVYRTTSYQQAASSPTASSPTEYARAIEAFTKLKISADLIHSLRANQKANWSCVISI